MRNPAKVTDTGHLFLRRDALAREAFRAFDRDRGAGGRAQSRYEPGRPCPDLVEAWRFQLKLSLTEAGSHRNLTDPFAAGEKTAWRAR